MKIDFKKLAVSTCIVFIFVLFVSALLLLLDLLTKLCGANIYFCIVPILIIYFIWFVYKHIGEE